MKNLFTEHPQDVGESYFKHLCMASLFGTKMIIGGLACIIHAFFPFLFEKTGSDVLIKLTQDFINRMPKVDDRITRLSDCIEKKKLSNGKVD